MKKFFIIVSFFLLGVFVFKGANTKLSAYYAVKVGSEIVFIETSLTKANSRAVILKRTRIGVTVVKFSRLQDIR